MNEIREITGRCWEIHSNAKALHNLKIFNFGHFHPVNDDWLRWISEVSPSLYPPVCNNPTWTSHSPALSHISSSLPLWSPAVNFPSKPLGHDWHDLGGGFNSLKGLSWLRPVSCYHYHRQAVALCLDPPSRQLELCGGSRGILTSPEQASLVGQCVFVCCFLNRSGG